MNLSGIESLFTVIIVDYWILLRSLWLFCYMLRICSVCIFFVLEVCHWLVLCIWILQMFLQSKNVSEWVNLSIQNAQNARTKAHQAPSHRRQQPGPYCNTSASTNSTAITTTTSTATISSTTTTTTSSSSSSSPPASSSSLSSSSSSSLSWVFHCSLLIFAFSSFLHCIVIKQSSCL